MANLKIATRFRFTAVDLPRVIDWSLNIEDKIYLCHRRDYHEDGSTSDYYYLELNHDQFIKMDGMELPESVVI